MAFMKTFLFLGFTALVMTMPLFQSCTGPGEKWEETKIFVLNAGAPDRSAIVIKNNGKEPALFKMTLNKLIYYNADAISEEINKESAGSEPVQLRAWKFVKNYTYFDEPLTESRWLHDPSLFLNSVGFGYCDDKAAALSFIWKHLGLASNVWNLGGHVVPEVSTTDGMAMYDPEFEVYYKKKTGTVAGVKDLIDNPSLIVSGYKLKLPCNTIHALWNRYSSKTARIYQTTENDSISAWYSKPVATYSLQIKIPPGGLFEFPAKYEESLVNNKGDTISCFANARLTIPKRWAGAVDIPLVIHAVNGKGTLTIKNVNYYIGSSELKNLIDSRKSFVHELSFESSHENIEVIYLLNPLMVKMEKENTLEIQGNHIDSISVSTRVLQEKNYFKMPERYQFPQAVYDIDDYMKLLQSAHKIQIVEENDIYRKLLFLITGMPGLAKDEMTEKYSRLFYKTKDVLRAVHPKVNLSALLQALNDDACYAVFISLMEYLPADDLIKVINENGNLKKHGKLYVPGI